MHRRHADSMRRCLHGRLVRDGRALRHVGPLRTDAVHRRLHLRGRHGLRCCRYQRRYSRLPRRELRERRLSVRYGDVMRSPGYRRRPTRLRAEVMQNRRLDVRRRLRLRRSHGERRSRLPLRLRRRVRHRRDVQQRRLLFPAFMQDGRRLRVRRLCQHAERHVRSGLLLLLDAVGLNHRALSGGAAVRPSVTQAERRSGSAFQPVPHRA